MSKQIECVKVGAHGQGSLRKFEGSPNWVFCYHQGGKEHRDSTKTPDVKKARKIAKQRLDELAADRQGLRKFVPAVAQRATVGELLDNYEADCRLREAKSIVKMVSHAKPVRAGLGAMRATDLTAERIDKYIAERLGAGKSKATVNRGLTILKTALKLAQRRGALVVAPEIRTFQETNVRRVFYTHTEFEALVAALPDYLQDAARFAFYTGWRKGEIVALRWEWVDLAAGQILVPTTKNTRPRSLKIGGELIDLFKRREQARLVETPDGRVIVSDFVFHRQGAALGDFKKAWRTALMTAGLAHKENLPNGDMHLVNDRTFHDFRRTAARNMIQSGVREIVAMTVTGHVTRAMFDRYAITTGEDQEKALEAVTSTAEHHRTPGSLKRRPSHFRKP
jgi:integrase